MKETVWKQFSFLVIFYYYFILCSIVSIFFVIFVFLLLIIFCNGKIQKFLFYSFFIFFSFLYFILLLYFNLKGYPDKIGCWQLSVLLKFYMIIWKFEKNSCYQSKNSSKDRDTGFVRGIIMCWKKKQRSCFCRGLTSRGKVVILFLQGIKKWITARPCFYRGSSAKIKCDLASAGDQHLEEKLWFCFCRESKSE